MTPFFPSNCGRCGYKGESNLAFSGPHVKKTCGHCGSYIKFENPVNIPDLREIKLAIMELAGGMLSDIEEAKKECRFFKEEKTLNQKIQYWKLLIHFIREEEQGRQISAFKTE